jgi:hypothetical protein
VAADFWRKYVVLKNHRNIDRMLRISFQFQDFLKGKWMEMDFFHWNVSHARRSEKPGTFNNCPTNPVGPINWPVVDQQFQVHQPWFHHGIS